MLTTIGQAVKVSRCRLGTKVIVPMRTSVISGPPRNRVSMTEKLILGGIMCSSVCFIPGYILVNLKHYTAGQATES